MSTLPPTVFQFGSSATSCAQPGAAAGFTFNFKPAKPMSSFAFDFTVMGSAACTTSLVSASSSSSNVFNFKQAAAPASLFNFKPSVPSVSTNVASTHSSTSTITRATAPRHRPEDKENWNPQTQQFTATNHFTTGNMNARKPLAPGNATAVSKRKLATGLGANPMAGGPLVDITKAFAQAENHRAAVTVRSEWADGQRWIGLGWGGEAYATSVYQQQHDQRAKRTMFQASMSRGATSAPGEIPVALPSVPTEAFDVVRKTFGMSSSTFMSSTAMLSKGKVPTSTTTVKKSFLPVPVKPARSMAKFR